MPAICDVDGQHSSPSLRLQLSFARKPVSLEAFVVFLKFGFGLAFRNGLPRQYRIEGPSIGLVLNLFRSSSLWLDHLAFAFSPSSTRRRR
jgi:hypothetical protein